MTKFLACNLKVGDVVLPPARELSLWMRRRCAEYGLKESALNLTIKEVREGNADKKGRWIFFVCDHSAEWNEGRNAINFTFKARPETPWPVISRA